MATHPSTPSPAVAPRPRRWAPWWLWLLGLSLGAVHLLPHLGARLVDSPPERVYVGFTHMVPDHVSYLGFAEQARRDGGFPLANPYTTEPQDGRFAMLYFWLVGVLAWIANSQVLPVWYALTPLCSLLMVLSLWQLSRLLFDEPGWCCVAVLMTSLGGGLGWLGIALSPRLASLEVVHFRWNWSVAGAMALPMWTLSHALLVLATTILFAQALGLRREARWYRRLAPLAAVPMLLLLSYLVHPYTGLAALAVAGLVALATPKAAGELHPWRRRLAGVSSASLGALVISGVILWSRADSVYRATSGNVFAWTDHYSPLWYPLMYGLLLLLGAAGALSALRDPGARSLRPVVAWCLTTMALSCLWFVPGVKFQYLVSLPLGLLATQGLRTLVARWPALWQRPRRQRVALATALALVLAGDPALAPLRDVVPHPDSPIFVSKAQLDLLAALRALPEGGVMAPPSVAVLVPWKAVKPVYSGHWFLTPEQARRYTELSRFYRPDTPEAWRADLLARARARYVVEDPWTAGLVPARLSTLVLVERYRNPFGRVLEVTAGTP